MTYIKHNGNFYKQVDLKKLTKEELVDLITNAIEVEPQIIERRNAYPVYRDRYTRWDDTIVYLKDSYLNGNVITNLTDVECRGELTQSSYNGDITSDMLTMSHDDLVTLCNTI